MNEKESEKTELTKRAAEIIYGDSTQRFSVQRFRRDAAEWIDNHLRSLGINDEEMLLSAEDASFEKKCVGDFLGILDQDVLLALAVVGFSELEKEPIRN